MLFAPPFARHGERSVASRRRSAGAGAAENRGLRPVFVAGRTETEAKSRSFKFYKKVRLIRLEYAENPRLPTNCGFNAVG
jgi:hypothetical protein